MGNLCRWLLVPDSTHGHWIVPAYPCLPCSTPPYSPEDWRAWRRTAWHQWRMWYHRPHRPAAARPAAASPPYWWRSCAGSASLCRSPATHTSAPPTVMPDGASCAARLAAVRNAALSMVKFKNIPPLRGSIEHTELVLQFGVFRFPAGS